jgi:hypothetical protein
MNKFVGLFVVGLLAVVTVTHDPVPAAQPLPMRPTLVELSPPAVSPDGRLSRWRGRWSVNFANGVHQVHVLNNDYTATVSAHVHKWSSRGRVELKGESVTITYRDDRVERWTPVGDRMVVEHWYPASKVPVIAPVLGIGERIK